MSRTANVQTPSERSAALDKANAKAKRAYKGNLNKKRSVTDDEMVILTDMMVSLRLVGYSNSQIGAIVGLSKGQVSKVTSDEDFQKRLRSLREKLPEAAMNLGKAYLVEALQAVIHVLRTENDNALVLKAAAEVFDRFGIPKTSRTETKTEPTESPDELPKTMMNRLRQADPSIQEKVASLHESFTEGVERILMEGGKTNGDSDEA